MPEESQYLGREEVGADSYLGKTRYKITCRCLRCGHVYSKTVAKLTDDDPPCPKKACKLARAADERATMEANLRQMIEEEKAPGQIGHNVITRAVDKTAQIVMEDHHLTNLRDNVREGESVAPRLPPKMQEAADNFFNPKKQMAATVGSRRAAQMNLIGRRALAGAYRDMAVNPAQVTGRKPGEKALIKTGEEKLRNG
jgi:predicted  nucleic acid-binding Zn-ribbon protein